MELLYAYISKYRCFENQEVIFSNKYNVIFDKKKKTLKISKNADYINIYPNNIVGINAIVGKNSSGKTCLLDLLGERIDNRNKNNEIRKLEGKDPHKRSKIELKTKLNNKEFSSSYFLIYYFGEDSEGNSLFGFEATNYRGDYKVLFENNEMSIDTGTEGYFNSKGWTSFVFVIDKEEHFIYKGDTNEYKLNDWGYIQDNLSIILFKHDYRYRYRDRYRDRDSKAKDESKICVQRRNRSYKCTLKFDQINFLIEQMKLSNTELYKNKEYNLVIYFKYTHIEEINSKAVIYSYKDDEQNLSGMDEYEKIILMFVDGYTHYIFNYYVIDPNNSKELIDEIGKINEEYNFNNCFEKTKEYYYGIIKIIFESQLDEYTKEDINIDAFKKSVDEFHDFLKNSENNKIKVDVLQYRITVTFDKESTISNCKDFFDYCIDENEKNNLECSLMLGYISTEIEHLSDGELANLELYSSIYEQINYLTDNKKTKNFILLFDEIEREMHPEMCRELIFNLISFLNQFKENSFQLILSTHSPFLASDLRKENIIRLNKNEKKIEVSYAKENTFAQNIHLILKNDFFLNSTIGAYSKKIINEITNLLTKEEDEKVFLKKINTFLGRDEIVDISLAEKHLRTMISSIGENLIKNELLELLDRCKIFDKKDIDSQIELYKQKIEELELLKKRVE